VKAKRAREMYLDKTRRDNFVEIVPVMDKILPDEMKKTEIKFYPSSEANFSRLDEPFDSTSNPFKTFQAASNQQLGHDNLTPFKYE